MNLSNLINQILYKPPTKKITIRDPLCPKCKTRPRSISKVSGKVADYCAECKQQYRKLNANKVIKGK